MKTIKKIQEAGFEAISKVIGQKKAELIINYFKNKEENNI